MPETYEFDLIIKSERAGLSLDLINRLCEAGCDDATVGFQNGVFFMTFAREAESLDAAIASAKADAAKAGCVVEAAS